MFKHRMYEFQPLASPAESSAIRSPIIAFMIFKFVHRLTLSVATIFPGARNMLVNIFKYSLFHDDIPDFEERFLEIRCQQEFAGICTNYWSWPIKEETEIFRFEDLIDGESYVVANRTHAISNAENVIQHRNHYFEKTV